MRDELNTTASEGVNQDFQPTQPAREVVQVDAPAGPLEGSSENPEDFHNFLSYIEEVYHDQPDGGGEIPPQQPDPAPEAESQADGEPEAEADSTSSKQNQARPFSMQSRSLVLLDRGMTPHAWWRLVLIEVAILFGVAVGIELVFRSGSVGAIGWQPHPYWLLILVMSAARGAVAGLVAGTVASILVILGTWQQSAIEGFWHLVQLESFTDPVLFLGVGFLVGEFRDELAMRHRKLLRKHESLMETVGQLRREHDLLTQANLEFKRRFVDDTTQFGNLLDAAVMIESSSPSDIYDLALTMVVEHCGASMSSVLVVMEEGVVDLAREAGWGDDDTRQRLDEANDSPQVRRCIEEGVRINGLSPDDAPPTSGPLVVAPVPDSSGIVHALLCLDEIPASRFNESTASTFFGIAEWVGASLKRISRGEKPFDFRAALADLANSAPSLGSPQDLGERMFIEDERCSRLGIASSLLTLQMTEFRPSGQASMNQLDDYVQENFSTGLRLSDGFFRFGYPGCYVMILVGARGDDAEIVRTRMQRRLGFLVKPETGKIEITTFCPDDESPDLARMLPRIVDYFREHSPIPLQPRCPVPIQRTTVLGTLEDFVQRLRYEVSLAQRYDKDLQILDFKTTGDRGDSGQMVARHLEHIAETWLRGTDGIYVVGSNRCAVVLPGSNTEHASRVIERITESLRERIPEERVGSFEPSVHGIGNSASRSLLDTFFGADPQPPID